MESTCGSENRVSLVAILTIKYASRRKENTDVRMVIKEYGLIKYQ